MNQESFLQCHQIMLQGLADKGFIHAKSPKFDLFFGMKDKNKIEFDIWERQVLAAAIQIILILLLDRLCCKA